MKIVDFLTDETGTISVDWAVLSAAVAVMSLAAVGVLSTATNAFSSMQAQELALQNAGGRALLNTDGYVPSDAGLYQAFIDGLTGLSLEELDAVAGFANRLHASGAATGLSATDVGSGCATTQAAGNLACSGNGSVVESGYQDGLFFQDFIVAVDSAYTTRGQSRPTHTRINRNQVSSAFAAMGLSQNEVAALWSI